MRRAITELGRRSQVSFLPELPTNQHVQRLVAERQREIDSYRKERGFFSSGKKTDYICSFPSQREQREEKASCSLLFHLLGREKKFLHK